MKVIRRILFVAVAGLTLAIGIGAVAGLRFTYATAISLVSSYRAKAATEPVDKTPDMKQPAIPEFVSDESCGGSAEIPGSAFDPTGDYSLDADTVPKSFSDIEYLTIQTRDYYEENGEYLDRPIVPHGSMRTRKELKIARIAIGDKELSFQTDIVDGVSYRFVGRFQDEENYESETDMPNLTGRLIKIKNGKWAAEMEARFYLQCGC